MSPARAIVSPTTMLAPVHPDSCNPQTFLFQHSCAHTMFYENEVRSAPRLELTPKFSNKELSMAVALVKGYEGVFDPTQFKNLYQERVQRIIDAAVSSRTHTKPPHASGTTSAPDLMEQIRLSLAQLVPTKRDTKKPVHKLRQLRRNPKGRAPHGVSIRGALFSLRRTFLKFKQTNRSFESI